MKEKYEIPSIEMISLVTWDIIVTSNRLLSGLWSEAGEGVIDFSEWLETEGENNG